MLRIGCHISSAGGYFAMACRAEKLGAKTFAFFTRNPRGGSIKALDPEDLHAFENEIQIAGLDRLVAHAPYTLNPCGEKESVLQFAEMAFAEDLIRMETASPNQYYNFHPGSHVGQGVEIGIEKISGLLNRVLNPEQTTTVLLETMAGKGSEVGRNFQELRAIMDRVEDPGKNRKIGVCLDTCHVWDGGYDIVNDLDGVLTEFDHVIGLERLKAIHLNDSMNVRGAAKDRHAKIGEGEIGLEALVRVINHPALKGLPFILETPNDEDGYAREIALLQSYYKE